MAALTSTPVAFPKQPIARCGGFAAPHSPISVDSEMSDQSTSPPPVSLLTLLRNPSEPPSSPPTESKSSPQPILRRDSVGSDADAVSSLHSHMASTTHKDEPRRALKFAVAAPHDPPSPHVHLQPHPPVRAPSPLIDDNSDDSSDGGYQEDEEDGEFSDDEDFAATIPRAPASPEFPFARPTNYDYGRRRSSDAPPAPAVLPPPPRRGRGHIRVVDDNAAPKTCSRHCSPPPARSRSGSEARSRVSDAGPREGRAGSPMPDVSDLPDVDDEVFDAQEEASDNAIQAQAVPVPRWRRASEHLPGFRKYDDGRRESAELCPPTITDETIVGSLSNGNQSDNVYHRLESNLASSSLTRARSMGAKVSFAPKPQPTEDVAPDERSQ